MKTFSFLLTFALAIFTILMAAGCGGGGTPYSPIITGVGKPTPDFTVSTQLITPTPVLIQQPEDTAKPRVKPSEGIPTITFVVTVAPVNGFTGAVSLGESQSNSAGFFSTGFTPSTVTLDGVHAVTSSFTVSLSDTPTAPGTYHFSIKGSANGVTHTASVQPTVIVQLQPTFTVTLTPNAVQTIPVDLATKGIRANGDSGNAVTWVVTVTATNGFVGSVKLTTTNPNSGAFSTAFSSPTLTFTSSHRSATSQFTVTYDGTEHVSLGDNNFNISATAGSTSEGVTAIVDISQID